MAPTDFCDGLDADSSAALACSSEPHHQTSELFPSTRSPLHHGTDPDLSAPTPLPAGVAATGLDLSPAAAGSLGLAVAKRKQRGSPALSAAAAPRAARPFPSGPRRDSHQPKRVATALSSPPRTPADGCGGEESAAVAGAEGVSLSLGEHTGCGGASEAGQRTTTSHATAAHMAVGSFFKPATATAAASVTAVNRNGGVSVARYGSEEPPSVPVGGSVSVSPMTEELVTEELVTEELVTEELAPPGLAPLVRAEPNNTISTSSSVRGLRGAGAAGDIGEREDGAGGRASARLPTPTGGDSLGTERSKKQMALKSMMAKAKMASDNIRLLLHAQRCQGGCKEPGCETARHLVEHMRGCEISGGAGCSAKCLQAQKMLQHYAECNRKRARGGRYCLVCSLVARSAAHGNNHHVQGANSNTASVGSNSFLHGRQPLGYLPPGTASRRGSASSVCGLRESAARAVGLQGPVAISRLKRAEWRQPGAASAVGADSAGGLGMVNLGRKQAKDGVFYRPLPKARSGSWGGYDRRPCLRRMRFDSIPEELAEEEGEDDEKEQQQAVVEGAGAGAGAGSISPEEGSRSKTLITAHSL